MKDILKTAPIIFIFFNRPDYTQIVFEQIKLAKPSKLFLISDGPRDDNNEDIILCAKSRKIVENIDWKCDVKINYSHPELLAVGGFGLELGQGGRVFGGAQKQRRKQPYRHQQSERRHHARRSPDLPRQQLQNELQPISIKKKLILHLYTRP